VVGQCALDVGRPAQLARERLDLAAFGGDLAGVGEVLVEVEVGVVAVPEARQLLAHAAPLFLELVAQHRVGRVRHEWSLLPALPRRAPVPGPRTGVGGLVDGSEALR
jgi:hypothetical protein